MLRTLMARLRGDDEDNYKAPINPGYLRGEPPEHPMWQDSLRKILDARAAAIEAGIEPRYLYLTDEMWGACELRMRLANSPNFADEIPAMPAEPKLLGMIVRRGDALKVE